MNSGRVQIPLGQRLFPRLICFPAVCELFTAARAGSCTKLLLSEKLIFKDAAVMMASLFSSPFPIPFFSSYLSSLPSPNALHPLL